MRCETREKKIGWTPPPLIIAVGNQDYVSLILRIWCTSYLSIDNELGDVENIDRFIMPQGMFAPRISLIRCARFSNFRLDCSIEISPHVTGFTRHHFSRRNQLGLKKYNVSKCAAGAGSLRHFLESCYLWIVAKTPNRVKTCFIAWSARIERALVVIAAGTAVRAQPS